MSCYPIGDSAFFDHSYLYSCNMPTQEAIDHTIGQLQRIQDGHSQFFMMQKAEGPIFVRATDIRTILVKAADANYAG